MGLKTLMLLREARLSDAAGIGEVHAEAWRVAYRDLFESEFLATQVEARRTMWSWVMEQPLFTGTTLLVAVRADRVVAFVHFGVSEGRVPKGELYDGYAHPSAWGSGVAEMLLSGAMEALADAGCRQVGLWTLAGANRARRFYVKSGFQVSGRSRETDFGDGRPVLELEYVRGLARPPR